MNSETKKRPKVIVVVHDAGGAEVIGAYIRAHRADAQFLAYGAGPAVAVFKRLRLPLRAAAESSKFLTAVMGEHADAAYALIAAPGWMTKVEINATKVAKKAGLKTVVYMDSWSDERKRFGYPKSGWKNRLPDEFWAGDRFAFASLKQKFSGVPVRLVPNEYFKAEVARFQELERDRKADAVLFTSNPGGECHELLETTLDILSKRNTRTPLRIRYHPGDNRHRYDALLRTYARRVDIEVSREKDLIRDLLRARVVMGTETVAMVVAVLCGVRAISLVKGGTKPMLPYKRIKRIRAARDVERLI